MNGGIMMKVNLSGINASAVARIVILLLALVNTTLQMLGLNTIPITNDEISNFVSILFVIGAALYNAYKNFNVSKPSQIAQILTDCIKNGEIAVDQAEEMIKKIKDANVAVEEENTEG